MTNMVKLGCILKQNDGWPPYDIEHLWFEKDGSIYRLKNFPMYVKGIAFDDVVNLTFDDDGNVVSWTEVESSGNSLVWIYEKDKTDVVDRLSALGCGVESGENMKLYAVNVPKGIKASDIDNIIIPLEDIDKISVAFPVDRLE